MVYCVMALISSVSGIYFMSREGTIGGKSMTIPFVIYEVLVLIYTIVIIITHFCQDKDYRKRWLFRMFTISSCPVFYQIIYILKCMNTECNILTNYGINWLVFIIPIIICELWLLPLNRIACCTINSLPSEDSELINFD